TGASGRTIVGITSDEEDSAETVSGIKSLKYRSLLMCATSRS
ncbi:hypothetical protein Tco_0501249, partial [Tanacetum coccineum]